MKDETLIKLYTIYFDDYQYHYLNEFRKEYYNKTNKSYDYALNNIIKVAEKYNLSPCVLIARLFSYQFFIQRKRKHKKPVTAAYITKGILEKVAQWDNNYIVFENVNQSFFAQSMYVLESVDIKTIREYKYNLISDYQLDNPKGNWKDLIKDDGILSIPPVYTVADKYVFNLVNNVHTGKEYIDLLLGNKDYSKLNIAIPNINCLKFIKEGHEVLSKVGYICE